MGSPPLITIRPIKFRAFHAPSSEMFEVFSFTDSHVYRKATESNDPDLTELIPYLASECALMQFTGVVDKIGVDVWEGDVLRWDRLGTDYPLGSLSEPDYSSYWHVTFYNGCFCSLPVGDIDPVLADKMYYSEYFHGRLDDLVVGNVYEHRHLWELTGEQPLASQ